MKSTIRYMCLFLVLSAAAQAQLFTFGPAVSGQVVWADVSSSVNDGSISNTPVPAYAFGAFARVKLLKFYIQPEVFYAGKGLDLKVTDASGESVSQQLRYETIDVNLMLGLQLFKFVNDNAGLRLHTGPGMNHPLDNSFRVNGNTLDGESIHFKPNTFNWQAGVGVDILNRFFVDLRYGVMLSDIVDSGDYKIIPSFGTVQIAYKLIKDK